MARGMLDLWGLAIDSLQEAWTQIYLDMDA